MSTIEDNPAYIHIVELLDVWHVNLMEFDDRAGDYQVAVSKQVASKGAAWIEAQEWAVRQGLEIR